MLKLRLMTAVILFVGIFLCACQQSPAPDAKNSANTPAENKAIAKTTDPNVLKAVQEMLVLHDKALNDQNLDALMQTFSTDPKVVMLGTGQGEQFVGTDAIKNAYTEIFKDYDKGTLETNCTWKTGDVDATGNMAWMGATCEAKDSMKGVARSYVLNVSAAAIKQNAVWRFIMLHMSNATSGPPPPVKK